MVNIFQKKESEYDKLITDLVDNMELMGQDSEEYKAAMEHLERLAKLRREDRGGRVSPDTLAVVAGNLLGILTIVAYEQKHVMVSKALGLILRSKQTN